MVYAMEKLCLEEACKMKLNCWECGQEIEVDIEGVWFESKGFYNQEKMNPPKEAWRRFNCEECEYKVNQQFIKDKQEYIKLKTIMTFERAIKSLESQKIDLYKYEEAIKAVKEFALEKPEKFDSSYEMIAAIILIQEKVKVKLQHSIDKYRADLYLEDFKCIVEIDGERHDESLLEDSNRDIRIRQILGSDWEVVRIPTKYLDENAVVLLKAIIELKKLKQKTRAKHGGIIPANFSKRDKAKADEIEKIVKR